ncbi:MAG TPA: hypothetical protein VKA06_00870 [Spirochaetia bacterium]|nr:hypothetical protein [Spirochaetia bacterium]
MINTISLPAHALAEVVRTAAKTDFKISEKRRFGARVPHRFVQAGQAAGTFDDG